MKEQTLEIEIENASKRIETRQKEIELELQLLVTQIDKYTTWAWRFVWFGAVIGILSTIFYLFRNNETGFGLNLLGDFMAGTVASIWSLAGLFFIYVAFLGQKQQLLNQQLEIMYSQLEVKYTRLELSGQKEEMMEQNKTLRQQKFENTFFNLLNLHHDIVNSIDLVSKEDRFEKSRYHFPTRPTDKIEKISITTTGRDCFVKFRNGYINKLNKNKKEYSNLKEFELVNKSYDEYYDLHQSDLGHYFRNLYHIFKFIKQSDIEDKKRYTSLVRAQLSNDELFLLFYNCISKLGSDKFKPLIEEYQLLKNLNLNDFSNLKEHSKYYDNGAFN